jgi:asparagine synthase (glutamine-hydrolysing)
MFTVPIGDWFKGESYEWLRRTLAGSDLMAEFFRPEVVEGMLGQHRDGSANFTRELRAFAAMALWDEQMRW